MKRKRDTMRASVLAIAMACGLMGAAPAQAPTTAPRIVSAQWFNTAPLKPASLDGKVRLVEFWTFDCVNCIRSVPAMRALHQKLGGSDVVLIGVHTPELERERDPKQVAAAVQRLDLRFPIALDDDHAIWDEFHNRYWPALYVIDKHGVIRQVHVGELHQGSPDWDELLALVDRLRREPA